MDSEHTHQAQKEKQTTQKKLLHREGAATASKWKVNNMNSTRSSKVL
jgi:hypothetical protein